MQWVLLWACVFLLLFTPLIQVILSQATLLHTHRLLVDYLAKVPGELNEMEVNRLLATAGFDEDLVHVVGFEEQQVILAYLCPLTKRKRRLSVSGGD